MIDQLTKLIPFLNAYQTWVKITILVLIFIIIALLFIIIVLLVFYYSPKKVDKASALHEMFDVQPIQKPGENIFHIKKQKTIGAIEEFFVKVHFNFWTRHPIEVININMAYSLPIATPGLQKIAFDSNSGEYEELDNSYRMKHRRKFEAGSVTNIFVSRLFNCRRGAADHADYGQVVLNFEIVSSMWKGIKNLQVKGKLEPGGRLKIEKTSLSVT